MGYWLKSIYIILIKSIYLYKKKWLTIARQFQIFNGLKNSKQKSRQIASYLKNQRQLYLMGYWLELISIILIKKYEEKKLINNCVTLSIWLGFVTDYLS